MAHSFVGILDTPSIHWKNIVCFLYHVIHDDYPLVICYIAIEAGPFIVDLPIKDDAFP